MSLPVIVGWLLALVAIVIFVELMSIRTDSITLRAPDVEIPPERIALIDEKRADGGFSPLGVTLSDRDYSIRVTFVILDQCIENGTLEEITSDTWLRTDGDCSVLPYGGPVEMLSTIHHTATADPPIPLATVRIPITEACYEALDVGATWPSDLAACAD